MTFRFACQAILFDLDGVLIDSHLCIERHWRRWAFEHRLDAEAILRTAHGRRTEETIALIAPHLHVQAEAAALTRAEERDTEGLRYVPGARELVASLPDGTWAVVTSGNKTTALTRLGFAGLRSPTVLISADDVSEGKPAPMPYLTAASQLGFDPTDCVVIEDTITGVASGKAAGMRAIAVGSTEELRDAADAMVSRLADVRITVERIHRRRLVVAGHG